MNRRGQKREIWIPVISYEGLQIEIVGSGWLEPDVNSRAHYRINHPNFADQRFHFVQDAVNAIDNYRGESGGMITCTKA